MDDDLVLILNNQLTRHGIAQHAEAKITQQAKGESEFSEAWLASWIINNNKSFP